jgi:hypothetical protein
MYAYPPYPPNAETATLCPAMSVVVVGAIASVVWFVIADQDVTAE